MLQIYGLCPKYTVWMNQKHLGKERILSDSDSRYQLFIFHKGRIHSKKKKLWIFTTSVLTPPLFFYPFIADMDELEHAKKIKKSCENVNILGSPPPSCENSQLFFFFWMNPSLSYPTLLLQKGSFSGTPSRIANLQL